MFDQLGSALLEAGARGLCADAAVRLGMSEGAVRVALHRLRSRFHELLRREVANTVSTPDEIDNELRYLMNAIAN